MGSKLKATVRFKRELTAQEIGKIASDFAVACSKAGAKEVNVTVVD